MANRYIQVLVDLVHCPTCGREWETQERRMGGWRSCPEKHRWKRTKNISMNGMLLVDRAEFETVLKVMASEQSMTPRAVERLREVGYKHDLERNPL